jgi:competence protein ComFC
MKFAGSLRADSPAPRSFASGCLGHVGRHCSAWYSPPVAGSASNRFTEAARIPICHDCLSSIRPIREVVCDKCGRPAQGTDTSDAEVFICPTCVNDEWGGYAFERVRSWAVYEGALVCAILLLKFEDLEPLGKLFARNLAQLAVGGGPVFEADPVVSAPLHRQRERERGYNQAALIAKPLAKRPGLPYRAVLLTRIRPRPDKHLLSYEERQESVRGAFATRPGSQVDNLRVLLVDDVMTSGATLDSCAKTLREAGARSVTGLTVARAILKNATEPLQ